MTPVNLFPEAIADIDQIISIIGRFEHGRIEIFRVVHRNMNWLAGLTLP